MPVLAGVSRAEVAERSMVSQFEMVLQRDGDWCGRDVRYVRRESRERVKE